MSDLKRGDKVRVLPGATYGEGWLGRTCRVDSDFVGLTVLVDADEPDADGDLALLTENGSRLWSRPEYLEKVVEPLDALRTLLNPTRPRAVLPAPVVTFDDDRPVEKCANRTCENRSDGGRFATFRLDVPRTRPGQRPVFEIRFCAPCAEQLATIVGEAR